MKSVIAITILEKEVGLRFGYDCMKDYTLACYEKPVYSTIDSVAGSAKLLESAHRNFCTVKESAPVVTYEEIYNWVEEMINDDKGSEVSDLINMWAESSATKKTLERIEEQKKSLTKELIAV